MLLSQPTNGIHSHQMVCDVIHCLYNNTQPASVTKIPLWLNGHSTGVSVGNWDRPATHSGYKARVTRHSSIWMKWVCFEYFNVLYWVIQIKCVDTAFKDLMEFSKCGFLDKFKKKKIFKLYDRKLSIKINRSRKCREIHLVYHFFCLYEIHTLQRCYSCTRALGAQSESLISASGSRSSTGSPLSQLHTEICGHVSVSPPSPPAVPLRPNHYPPGIQEHVAAPHALLSHRALWLVQTVGNLNQSKTHTLIWKCGTISRSQEASRDQILATETSATQIQPWHLQLLHQWPLQRIIWLWPKR